MGSPLLLRADAGLDIGTGHVMRLLALAWAWESTRQCLLGRVPVTGLRQRLMDAGMGLWDLLVTHPDRGDLGALVSLAAELHPAWVVLDGYHFDPDYQAAVRTLGVPVLVVDDMAHHSHYHADLLLNQNAGAGELHYAVDPDTRLLLGPRYCLLRPELRAARGPMREVVSRARRLLVTLGGADPRGLTALALAALAHLGPAWEARVVVGAANPRLVELREQAAGLQGVEVCADVRDMGSFMAWADLALAAAGSTTWELAYLGIPTLLVAVADNQRPVARAAAAAGCAADLGRWDDLTAAGLAATLEQLAADSERRAAMSTAGRALVDGEGAARVVQAMTGAPLRLRPVEDADRERLWAWSNDPEVRAWSFDRRPISWEDHYRWFAARCADLQWRAWIGVDATDCPVGVVRFQVQDARAEVSVCVAAAARGRGLGRALISQGCAALFRELPVAAVDAYLKPDNTASRAAFQAAGFQEVGVETMAAGQRTLRLVRERGEL
jgi:UDP-2,4-diacetamido-2,4,6-trideoxy-beta-L-altropyranose hydrolase